MPLWKPGEPGRRDASATARSLSCRWTTAFASERANVGRRRYSMADKDPAAPIGLLLSDDMMFTSRITGTARDLGLTIKTARAMDVLKTIVQSERPACIIVDLANPGLAISDLCGWLAATCSPAPRVVAYGSHV